jgi:1-acyl-sn-glycerol-3-phosphate acyltransferase
MGGLGETVCRPDRFGIYLEGSSAPVRKILTLCLLVVLKLLSRIFYKFDFQWVGDVPDSPWRQNYRVITMLNHTSLFEWLFVGALPLGFLWRIASRGLVPAADKTIRRPVVGWFFKMLAPRVVPISRQADHTWQAVIDQIDNESMVIILPEGRMKRADGLDKNGRPMSIRGGIADILRAIPEGKMLLAYSGGLHHIQVPGQFLPKPFKTLAMSLEAVDIPVYREALETDGTIDSFKAAVKADLTERRDAYCPSGREVWVR